MPAKRSTPVRDRRVADRAAALAHRARGAEKRQDPPAFIMPYGASELASEVAQVRDRRPLLTRGRCSFGTIRSCTHARLGAFPSLALRPSVSRRPEPPS